MSRQVNAASPCVGDPNTVPRRSDQDRANNSLAHSVIGCAIHDSEPRYLAFLAFVTGTKKNSEVIERRQRTG